MYSTEYVSWWGGAYLYHSEGASYTPGTGSFGSSGSKIIYPSLPNCSCDSDFETKDCDVNSSFFGSTEAWYKCYEARWFVSTYFDYYEILPSTTNCNGTSTIDSNPWRKEVVSIPDTDVDPSWNFSCEEHGYWWGNWSSWIGKGNHYNCPGHRYASEIQWSGNNYRILCQEIDDTPPVLSASDLWGFTPANDSHFVPIDYGTWQSGSGSFSATIEDYNNSSGTLPVSMTGNGFHLNMSLVDGGDRSSWNFRPYTLQLIEVCDEAWNCVSWLPNDYDYNVYAASISPSISILWSTSWLVAGNVADGTERNVNLRLRDQYNNEIIPVPWISRTVQASIDYTNSLYINEYERQWISWVDINNTPMTIWNEVFSLSDSSDGIYDFGFRTYAPTSQYKESEGWFTINSIYANVSDLTGDTTFSTSQVFDFKPLYTTTLSGKIKTQGFIEWATQDVSIAVLKANSTSTNSHSLRGEFWDVSGTNNITNSRYGFSVAGNTISEWQSTWLSTTELSSSLSNLNNRSTFMTQDGPVDNQTFSYFASIIKYNIWSKTIVYPGDIIWKDSYHGTAGNNNSYQEGIKIVGNTSSSNTQEITTNQFSDDIRILWKLTKATFRKDIDTKTYSVTRNITAKTGWSHTLSSTDVNANLWDNSKYDVGSSWSRGTAIFWESALYFWDGKLVTIAGATNIEWNKTIVVENGDVYISGNIENTDSDGILGIIVINGDILINTSVTDIHATLYTNRSILSSTNGTDRLDGSASSDQLANQLYIRGSLFSENTIGGSRKSTPECPYYVNSWCDQIWAQQYDLNYLRRYYIYDSDADSIPDTPSWVQSRANGQAWFENFPVIIDYNPAIQQTPPPLFD